MAERRKYPCCVHCLDVPEDHVEHGGSVEKDGHEAPCDPCDRARLLAEDAENVECWTCRSTGIQHGNGEDCRRCGATGWLKVVVVGFGR